jgi:hypothetical protein
MPLDVRNVGSRRRKNSKPMLLSTWGNYSPNEILFACNEKWNPRIDTRITSQFLMPMHRDFFNPSGEMLKQVHIRIIIGGKHNGGQEGRPGWARYRQL